MTTQTQTTNRADAVALIEAAQARCSLDHEAGDLIAFQLRIARDPFFSDWEAWDAYQAVAAILWEHGLTEVTVLRAALGPAYQPTTQVEAIARDYARVQRLHARRVEVAGLAAEVAHPDAEEHAGAVRFLGQRLDEVGRVLAVYGATVHPDRVEGFDGRALARLAGE